MQTYIKHLIVYFNEYLVIAIALIAFLESLALIGLVLPGTVIMTTFGALIGKGEINFWKAWMAGVIGCLLGGLVSFWFGHYFKYSLYQSSFIKRNRSFIDKIKHSLHQHGMFTIFASRFIGFMRPLVPIVSGMLDFPISKFIAPDFIGCILWPPFYFFPGILISAAVNVPLGKHASSFRWLFLITIIILWISVYLLWRLFHYSKKNAGPLMCYLLQLKLFWLTLFMLIVSSVMLIILLFHPMALVYRNFLLKVLST